MQFEAVRGVSVCNFRLQVRGQVDDVDSTERTFLRADTAADAQSFGDEGDLRLGSDLDAQLASANYRTGLLAFLTTFLTSVSLECSPLSHQETYLRFALQ